VLFLNKQIEDKLGDRAFPVAAAGVWNSSTSTPRSHCQSSAVASRHISSGAASRDDVVPEK